MSDEPVEMNDGSPLKYVLIAIAGMYVIASLVFGYNLNDRLNTLQKSQAEMEKRIEATDAKLKASTETLAAKVGMTEKELAARTAALQREQRASESRLTEKQKAQIGEVTTEVAGVKTDVAAARTDLEATKMKLDRAVGDLGQQSGLIARTREELDWLKHRGDKNYYEFTLQKGSKPTPVSTISLQLKKSDPKKSKFTMNVVADDRTIEKKDKTLYEPLQFITGRERQMYELVITAVNKNSITGYLATPKAAPFPAQ